MNYDLNGNLIRKTSTDDPPEITTYLYDAENRLIRVDKGGVISTFKYDGLGRRIEKDLDGEITRYIYEDAEFGSDIKLIYNGDNNLVSEITSDLGIDSPVISRQSNADHYYLTDGLGSVTELVDGSVMDSNIAKSYAYDSFGNIVSETGSLNNHSQYTGREYDAETGLYYYRARYYDAENGRFINEDLIAGFIEFSETLNLYPYVLNDPISYIDPTGEIIQQIGVILVGLYTGYELYRFAQPYTQAPEDVDDAINRRAAERNAIEKGNLERLIELDELRRTQTDEARKKYINSDTTMPPGVFPGRLPGRPSRLFPNRSLARELCR